VVRGSHFGLEVFKVELQMKLLRSNSRLGSLIILLDTVHTRVEVCKNGLRDVQTCGMILASAYVLCYLSAA